MKKTGALFLALIMTFLSVLSWFPCLTVSAEDDFIALDIFKKSNITKSQGVLNASDVDSRLAITTDLYTKSLSFTFSFEAIDLSGFTEIAFTAHVSGDEKSYPVDLVLSAGRLSSRHTCILSEGSETVYVKLPGNISGSFDSISLSFTDKNSIPGGITLTDCFADKSFSYAYISKFSVTDFSSEYPLEKSEDHLILTPSEGLCNLIPEFDSIPQKGTDILLWVSLSGITSGSVYSEALYSEKGTVQSPAQSISADGIFAFSLSGGFESVTLRFRDLKVKGSSFTVLDFGIEQMGKSTDELGTITSCRLNGSSISVSGSLSSQASVKYYGTKLLLYAIPAADAPGFDLSDYSPIAQTGFSTKFTLSASFNANHSEYLYLVAFDTDKGSVAVGPLCAPHTGSSASPAASDICAVHSTDDAQVFSTGVSSVIIDVDSASLFEKDDIYSAVSYKYGENVYFNRDAVSQLDSRVRFYTSAGISPYIRIIFDDSIIDEKTARLDKESLTLLCAVASFLAERFPLCKGFIMGSAINSGALSRGSDGMQNAAVLASVFSECVKSKNNSALVMIPIEENAKTEPYLSLTQLYYYLSLYKANPITVLLETSAYSSRTELTLSKIASVPAIFSTAGDGNALIWNVPSDKSPDEICTTYRTICLNSASGSLRLGALSVTDVPEKDKELLYTTLQTMLDSENVIPTSITLYSAKDKANEKGGKYSLWDFSNSYSTESFVCGGALTVPESRKSSFGEGRVLASTLKGSDMGVLVAPLDMPIDMSGTIAKLSFCISGSVSADCRIKIVFASGGQRAVFQRNVVTDTPITLFCDLSEFSGSSKVDFVSLIVSGTEGDTVELSKVELLSESLTDKELSQRFDMTEKDQGNPLFYAAILITAAITVAVFSFLLKRQKGSSRND